MSSDESAATSVSSVSFRNNKPNGQTYRPQKWEVDLIGNFLLHLYHISYITLKDNWCVNKAELRKKFIEFINHDQQQNLIKSSDTVNIGTLLYSCGFLLNTNRNSNLYKIKCKSLFDFRNNKLRALDKQAINNDVTRGTGIESGCHSTLNLNEVEEIDESVPKETLEYQGSTMQRRVNGFLPNNMCCFICQIDFNSMEIFEEHIQTHGDDTDFEFLSKLGKFNSQIFTLSYRLCKNSHNFCFEMTSTLDNLIIEKIIIVQSRSFFYVHNMRVPYEYPENCVDRFFVDSHLFTRHLEQPIVILCHLKGSDETLFVEQHHFMRSKDFPQVRFSINPNRLPSNLLFKPKFQLADYFPPKEIQKALGNDFYHQSLMTTSNEFRDYIRNEKKLQPQTIGASLNILLQIEDMDTIQQYLNLKETNIKLRSYGDEYSFQLKPSRRVYLENIISAYDEVILTTRNDILTSNEKVLNLTLKNTKDIHHLDKNTFVGLIQAINNGRICFKCDKTINLNCTYTVIFRPSRLNFRYQYRALELLTANIEFLKKFLFPAKIIPMPLPTTSIDLYNCNINEEQLQAVRNIALGPRNDATYIIFGPPGTGKTTTLVESILQLLRKPNTKILVTASSNSACEEVALRLCNFLPCLDIARCLVRIYSRSCEVRTENISEIVLENSNMYNGQFYPDIEILHDYRVVICTLSVVAKLATGKFGRANNGDGVYTHLLIDEVAATMEPEALTAMTTILTPKSSLIISGDHKQLGPVLKSMRAIELGLNTSLMDRLLARDCYRVDVDTGDYDRTIQTRLTRNYRSHPAIVNLYSGLYYNHSLESCAKQENVSLCESWHKLCNKDYPILFHAIYEPSKSDRHSHSLLNFAEINLVMDYVKDLIYFGINDKPIKESDIGIISPYKKQYQYIREQLNLRKWFDIETGSVETFQGKEKEIIIVSFVRSGTENLGFLDNPRRLNVTLSRPKCILILIGNPTTLSLNKDFEYIIKECKRNNTYFGRKQPMKSVPKQKLPHTNKQFNETLELMQDMQQPEKVDQQCEEKRVFGRTKNNIEGFDVEDLVNLNLGKKLDQNKTTQRSYRRSRKNGQRNRNKSTNQGGTENNKDDERENDDDDTDNKSQVSVKNSSKNTSSSTNAGKDDGVHFKKDVDWKDCKISKEGGTVGDLNTSKENTNPFKICSIFKDLPQVPTAPEISLTADQMLLLQQRQEHFLNTEQRKQQFHLNHNAFNASANLRNNNFRQPTPTGMNQRALYLPMNMPVFQNNVFQNHHYNNTNPNKYASPNNHHNNTAQQNKAKIRQHYQGRKTANWRAKKTENLDKNKTDLSPNNVQSNIQDKHLNSATVAPNITKKNEATNKTVAYPKLSVEFGIKSANVTLQAKKPLNTLAGASTLNNLSRKDDKALFSARPKSLTATSPLSPSASISTSPSLTSSTSTSRSFNRYQPTQTNSSAATPKDIRHNTTSSDSGIFRHSSSTTNNTSNITSSANNRPRNILHVPSVYEERAQTFKRSPQRQESYCILS